MTPVSILASLITLPAGSKCGSAGWLTSGWEIILLIDSAPCSHAIPTGPGAAPALKKLDEIVDAKVRQGFE